MKVYTFSKYKRLDDTGEEHVWSSAHATMRDAVKAMHRDYLSDMYLSYGELDMKFIRQRWRIALKRGGEFYNAVERETDFSAIYDIFTNDI